VLRGAGAAAARLSSALHTRERALHIVPRLAVAQATVFTARNARPTQTNAEPTVLLLSGAGLVVAAVLRRSRRS